MQKAGAADADPLHDVVERSAAEPVLGETLQGRLEDRPPCALPRRSHLILGAHEATVQGLPTDLSVGSG